MRNFISPLVAILLAGLAGSASAEFISFEKASSQLQSATVTVRVIPSPAPRILDGEDVVAAEDEIVAPRSVEVCSGASLGDGLVVTYAEVSTDDEVRITIPGGEQAKAKLRVVDHVSGLTLLEIDKQDVPGLAAAKQLPEVGGWVLAGAGWGAEKPVVSFGILSGTNRTLRGGTFPPLLQCDLRAADTSNGAPLVNQNGELIGVIVATDAPGSVNRWTYAVPVEHVQRLVRAREPDKMIKLDSRRPVVGLRLVPGNTPDTVFVGRVEKGGPADKAGLQPGDQVLAAEGLKVRSVYEVLRPLLAKQPGAKMNFTVKQAGQERDIHVVLGGGTVIQPAPRVSDVAGMYKPSVVVQELGYNHSSIIVVPRQVSTPLASPDELLKGIQLQDKAATGYLSALDAMHRTMKQQQATIAEQDAELKLLRSQIQSLQEAGAR